MSRPVRFGRGGGARTAVWEKLHALLLTELHPADQLEWERAIADSTCRGEAGLVT